STNNRMELQAVIQAIKHVDPRKSILIRTDSQYVTDAVSGRTIVKANGDLWREYQEVSKLRQVKVVWVKGHAGDPYNETADQLATEQARLARAETMKTAGQNP